MQYKFYFNLKTTTKSKKLFQFGMGKNHEFIHATTSKKIEFGGS